MAGSWEEASRSLHEAAAFAARAHRNQFRKDGQTPYVSHVFRVCLVVRDIFGIDDRRVLSAALLHDTLEDTTTDFDDLEEQFGAEVAGWVAALSKDKRKSEIEREKAYTEELARAPWQVKVCKLGDIFDNLMDMAHLRPQDHIRPIQHAHRYLDALKEDLPEPARRPWQIVSELLAQIESRESNSGGA